MRESPLVLVSWCVLFFAILEASIAKKRGFSVYSKAQTEIALGLAIGQLFVSLTVFAFLQKLIFISPQNKPFSLPLHTAWGLLAFVALDFLAYLNHYLSHKISLFWADHAVHHANPEFNFVTHLAHGWTGFVSATLVISLLMGLFNNIEMVVLSYFLTATLVQTLAHTQVINKLGFLEHFLVTPSHHRVHHAVERSTHDHNYGIVLIIWDKLFGTFQPEGATQQTKFGLANSPKASEPLWRHAFFGWQDYFKNYFKHKR